MANTVSNIARWMGIACLIFTSGSVQAELSDSLSNCRELPDVMERVQCYDAIVDDMREQPERHDNRVDDTVQPKSLQVPPVESKDEGQAVVSATAEPSLAELTPEELFGKDPIARTRAINDAMGESELKFVEARVTQVNRTAVGKLQIVLDNGQVWRQLDSRSLQLKENSMVLIRAASLGSFLLEKLPGSRSIRVKRID